MPNLHVLGLDAEEARSFSRHAATFFERELGTPRQHVHVLAYPVRAFQDGEEETPATIIRVSWIRRPREHFEKAVAGLTRIVKEDLGRQGSVQVELHEKWDDGAVDGELCSDWAARVRGRL
jgi:hypothetical protein